MEILAVEIFLSLRVGLPFTTMLIKGGGFLAHEISLRVSVTVVFELMYIF